ncbi:hypothetical protein SKAU_G00173820 [Synaphobranchus kaupii]|uniref:Uncharacterized protein n=1 Tax=Synaphobranchus kaupii TaxID=118154 RepID=A0A9Q1J138_SYNKA|nr:hypothetical protein SKAU_G00173820 [Synaphobranchus kaupii]
MLAEMDSAEARSRPRIKGIGASSWAQKRGAKDTREVYNQAIAENTVSRHARAAKAPTAVSGDSLSASCLKHGAAKGKTVARAPRYGP